MQSNICSSPATVCWVWWLVPSVSPPLPPAPPPPLTRFSISSDQSVDVDVFPSMWSATYSPTVHQLLDKLQTSHILHLILHSLSYAPPWTPTTSTSTVICHLCVLLMVLPVCLMERSHLSWIKVQEGSQIQEAAVVIHPLVKATSPSVSSPSSLPLPLVVLMLVSGKTSPRVDMH